MNWHEILIHTTSEGIDAVTGSLLQIGINGFAIEDKKDFNEFLSGTQPYWDYVDEELMKIQAQKDAVVKFYVPQNAQGKETIAAMNIQMNRLKADFSEKMMGTLEIEQKSICEEDWANNWKQYFKPFCVGKHLFIKPSWETVPADAEKTVIQIDPGSSFGTGQHHTTKLCLEQLEQLVKKGDKVLDLGCGSGILSIAAIHLGAMEATAIDIDENAVNIAKQNAAVNGIDSNRFQAFTGNVLEDKQLMDSVSKGQFDIVCANIVADIIIPLAPCFQNMIRENGKIILSGIIEQRKQDVIDAFSDSELKIEQINSSSDWMEFTLSKR